MPAVTVLMGFYNASGYLAEAIESVLSQTYSDFEFVAVNDGSTDSTRDILGRYASRDARITLLDKANTGLADSLNVGIEAAKGQWIARMDADDVLSPDRLARQLLFVEQHESVVLLGSGCHLVDAHGTFIRDYRYPLEHRGLVAHMADGGAAFPHSSAFFRKETAVRIGQYNTRFTRGEDLDLWLRLSRVGEIASLPELLVDKREHSANLSNNCAMVVTMDLAARVCHFIRSRGVPDPSREVGDDGWIRFIGWLKQQMDDVSYVECQSEWFRIRRAFQASLASGGKVRAAAVLAQGLFGSGYGCRIAKEKLLGANYPSRLADRWIHNQAGGQGVS